MAWGQFLTTLKPTVKPYEGRPQLFAQMGAREREKNYKKDLAQAMSSVESQNAELPEDQRLNADQLQIKKFQAGADAIRGFDPGLASKYEQGIENINKRIAAGNKKSAYEQPEAVRQKIQSAMNPINNLMSSLVSKGINVDEHKRLMKAFKEEQTKDNPSIKQAYINANVDPRSIDIDNLSDENAGNMENVESIEPSFYDEEGTFKKLSDREVGVLQSKFPSKFAEYESQEQRFGKLEEKKYGRKEREEREKYTRGKDYRSERLASSKNKIQQDKEYLQSWNAKLKLEANPGDITRKRAALNVKLRDETGAAIGANEFSDMMSFVLPADDYQDFREETTGMKAVLLGMANEDAREAYLKRVAEDFLGKVDDSRLAEYIDDSISPEYYKKKNYSKEKAKEKSGKAINSGMSRLERIRALRAGK